MRGFTKYIISLRSAEPSPVYPHRNEWYQTDSEVVISVFIKNVQEDQLKVELTETSVRLPSSPLSAADGGSAGEAERVDAP